MLKSVLEDLQDISARQLLSKMTTPERKRESDVVSKY